jgi:hypothetical protein
MFVGHYAVSFALARRHPRVSLGWFFIAVQFLDVLWAIFILTGIEKARIVPHFLAASPLDLYYMPYTHSLVAAIGWSILIAVIAADGTSGRMRGAAVALGLAVFSHFVADLIVHAPDLALYDSTGKMGLGVWNYAKLTYALEAVLLIGSAWYYLRGADRRRTVAIWIYVALLLVVNAVNIFGSPPANIQSVAILAEFLYILFAVMAVYAARAGRKQVP